MYTLNLQKITVQMWDIEKRGKYQYLPWGRPTSLLGTLARAASFFSRAVVLSVS